MLGPGPLVGRGDRGVIDQYIQSAELRQQLLEQAVHNRAVGNVASDPDYFGATSGRLGGKLHTQFSDALRQGLGIATVYNHPGALAQECFGHAPPQPLRATGNQYNPVPESHPRFLIPQPAPRMGSGYNVPTVRRWRAGLLTIRDIAFTFRDSTAAGCPRF